METNIDLIITAYNIANFIGEALESALGQDPPFAKIIVVDDGSTDGTREAVAKFNDSRILYHHQNNQGLGPARNAGLELATGEFIYFMDGDDILEPNMVSSFCGALTNNPDLSLYAFSAVDFENGSGRLLGSSDYMQRKCPNYFNSGRDALLDGLQRHSFPACAVLYIFRRSTIEGDRHLRFMNIVHEDEVFTPALFMNCGKTIVSSAIYYRRRIRNGSITTTPASIRNVTGMLQAMQWWATQASHAQSGNSKTFRLEAHRCYNQAVRYASHAKIGINTLRDLVADYGPFFSNLVPFDYALGRFSKRIAFEIGSLRARFVSWPG